MKTLSLERFPGYVRLFFLGLGAALFLVARFAQAAPLSLADSPLFLSNTATPLVMLNISKDHQLYFKAYDDYSDLNGDGAPDTTYNNSINYYGYFDSVKCYNYNTVTARFEPYSLASNNYCNGYWSGNFLNWATMSRIDTIRKILYGGLRSTDTGTINSNTTTNNGTPVTTYGQPVVLNVSQAPFGVKTTTTIIATILDVGTGQILSNSATSTCTDNVNNQLCAYQSVNSVVNSPGTSTTVQGAPTATTVNNVTTTTTTSTTTSQYTSTSTSSTLVVSGSPNVTSTTQSQIIPNGADSLNFSLTTTITVAAYNLVTTVTATPATTVATTTTTVSGAVTPGVTVLERAYIPNDGHSFAKFYNGADLPQLTPFSGAQTSNGVTLCNTTVTKATVAPYMFSQNVMDPPLIRVAAGNFMLWNANERWQCRWADEIPPPPDTAFNFNNLSPPPYDNKTVFGGSNPPSGIPPYKSAALGAGDYVARVQVCANTLIGNESCKAYSNGSLTTLKPVGLLQTYGDTNQLNFGLLTGSYGKNKSGGVLRKNVSSMNNEINIGTDGTFIVSPSGGGIIDTLNRLRMYGYKHNDGTYYITGSLGYPSTLTASASNDGSANCMWGLTTFTDGNCSNWGNPQAEMYLESLRYLAGFGATPDYLPAAPNLDSSYIPGMNVATTAASTQNPSIIPSAQWCANLSVINFNASSISYDGDQLNGVSDLGAVTANPLTDAVGAGEGVPGNSFFVGANGAINDQLCTAKTVNSLSGVSGVCPDAPRLSGTYQIAGLAWYGHTNDLIPSLQGNQSVTTYAVALAPKLPVVTLPVPGSSSKSVNIIPACQNSSLPGNCTQTDFKIITQLSNRTATQCGAQIAGLPADTYNCGTLYINWDDSEQGGDFDMDAWGLLSYAVGSKSVYISTKTVYQSTPYAMGFGYAISGTSKDGFHAHSGINGYNYTDSNAGVLLAGNNAGCTKCQYNDPPSTVSYPIGSASATSLQQPLWYAAKWGGFHDFNQSSKPDKVQDWDVNADGLPDNYYYATNPASLASAMTQTFNQVIGANAASSSAAANSGNLQTGTVLYQAQFNSSNWSGHLYEISLLSSGALNATSNNVPIPNWDAAALLPAASVRNIQTYNGSAGVAFQWPADGVSTASTLSASQMQALETSFSGVIGSATQGQQRLNWIRGDQSNELQKSGYLRNRSDLLGDIINSNPVYTQAESYGYSSLPSTAPEQSATINYATFLASKAARAPMLYEGANDGMLHGFNATNGAEQFAYVPAAVYGNLGALTDPQYTHKYFVDGTVTISDAYIKQNGNSYWSTVLLSGLNKGGKAIFALDVSNPTAFSASNVLWEYSGSASTDTGSTGVIDANGLGYTYAQPQVARMHDGSWAAIFGNGYDSVSGQAFLYIVDLNTGVLVKKIPTNSAAGNGLSTAVLYDYDGDSIIDYAYAGDLQGNLWKFDLTAKSSSGWVLGNGGQPLFTAVNSNNQIQPITSKPLLAVNPMGGWMVYFGTGEYLTTADIVNTDIQAFYAVWDKPSATGTAPLSSLVAQTITETVNSGTTNPAVICQTGQTCNNTYTNNYRSVSGFTVDPDKNRGWYLNLTPSERVRTAPVLINGLILFLTTIPSDDPCTPGGTSWLMEVNYLSGGAPGVSPFDLNNDGKISTSDILAKGGIAAGVQSTVGLVAGTVLVGAGGGKTYKYNYGSSSQTQVVTNYSPTKVGTVNRVYWMQIQ